MSIKPTCDSKLTKSCKGETVSAHEFANNRVSAAKRRSSSAGWPSPRSNPFEGASCFQPRKAHCSAAKNKRGLRTHALVSRQKIWENGQVRPVRQRRARFRAQAQKMKICTQLLFTCGKNLQTNQDVSSIGCCPMPHLSNIQDSHIGSTHQALNPRCFVDGPHVEMLINSLCLLKVRRSWFVE